MIQLDKSTTTGSQGLLESEIGELSFYRLREMNRFFSRVRDI